MGIDFRLSIAIPVHNEVTVLPELFRRTLAVLDQIEGGPHELVIVDDGSTDGTLEVLEREARQDRRILVISLSRNFGHQAALTAALDHASGDAVVLMDGDLQDVPEAIPQFVQSYWDGYDVVYAQRIRRKESWPLRICYFLFYRVMARLSDLRVPLDAGDFGLLSRRVIEELTRMPEHHRYTRGLRSWVGFKQLGIAVERGKRHSGKSKYSFTRLLKLAADGIFAFSILPIRAAALLGCLSVVGSTLFALYAAYKRVVLHESPIGFTALIFVTTFLSGIILLFLGVIGEYIGRIYEEAKARPLYVVGRVYGGQTATPANAGGRARAATARGSH